MSTQHEAKRAVKSLQNALSEFPALEDVHVTSGEWDDGTWWVGIALTPDEAFQIAEAMWQED